MPRSDVTAPYSPIISRRLTCFHGKIFKSDVTWTWHCAASGWRRCHIRAPIHSSHTDVVNSVAWSIRGVTIFNSVSKISRNERGEVSRSTAAAKSVRVSRGDLFLFNVAQEATGDVATTAPLKPDYQSMLKVKLIRWIRDHNSAGNKSSFSSCLLDCQCFPRVSACVLIVKISSSVELLQEMSVIVSHLFLIVFTIIVSCSLQINREHCVSGKQCSTMMRRWFKKAFFSSSGCRRREKFHHTKKSVKCSWTFTCCQPAEGTATFSTPSPTRARSLETRTITKYKSQKYLKQFPI